MIGGISAKITGGRFEDGAVSAAFRWLFNDEAKRVTKIIKKLEVPNKRFRIPKIGDNGLQMTRTVPDGGEDFTEDLLDLGGKWYNKILGGLLSQEKIVSATAGLQSLTNQYAWEEYATYRDAFLFEDNSIKFTGGFTTGYVRDVYTSYGASFYGGFVVEGCFLGNCVTGKGY